MLLALLADIFILCNACMLCSAGVVSFVGTVVVCWVTGYFLFLSFELFAPCTRSRAVMRRDSCVDFGAM